MKNVLVVDDDLAVRRLIRMTLERLGYSVAEAGTGDKALTCLHQSGQDFCLIFLDYTLPDLNGERVLETIRQDPRTHSLKVVLMGGLAPSLPFSALLGSHLADSVLIKPFSSQEVIQQVNHLLTPSAHGQ